MSAGILEAHGAGAVAATSMMVHCPGWDDGVRQVRATPTLDVGLHFNMLIGRPLTAARSLRRASGEFHSLRGLAIRALAGAIRGAEVERECEAQLDALGEAGIRVTHIDSHRHTHALPVIHGAVARVAVARGLVLRRPVESARWFPGDVASLAHRALVAAASRLSAVNAPRPRAADHFVGISLQGRAAFAARLARVIAMLPAGTTELMVHPGHADDTLATVDGYTHERERELAALTAPGLRARLGGDAALIGFDAV